MPQVGDSKSSEEKPVSTHDRQHMLWHLGRSGLTVIHLFLAFNSILIGYAVSPSFVIGFTENVMHIDLITAVVTYPILTLIPCYIFNMLNITNFEGRSSIFAKAILCALSTMGIFIFLFLVFRYAVLGRYILVTTVTVHALSMSMVGIFIWKMANQNPRRLLFWGNELEFNQLLNDIEDAHLPVSLKNFISYGKLKLNQKKAFESLACSMDHVDEIVIGEVRSLSAQDREFLIFCTRRGIQVTELAFFYEKNLFRVNGKVLDDGWFWRQDPHFSHPLYFSFKRMIDFSMSFLLMVFLSPLMLCIAILVYLSSGGPVIYRQIRVGQNNKNFTIYKFRTMRADSELVSGAQWAKENDDRVTPLGRFLRKSRIDELPQLWNIFVGHMSFIGPRPERPELIEVIETKIKYYHMRHLVKPGLSGWAQIHFRYGASMEDTFTKLGYDLYYLKNTSIILDVQIALSTIMSIFKGSR